MFHRCPKRFENFFEIIAPYPKVLGIARVKLWNKGSSKAKELITTAKGIDLPPPLNPIPRGGGEKLKT